MWQPGLKVIRPFSPESGVGVVVGVEDRFLDVFFPDTMERLKLSPEPESVQLITLQVGALVRTPTNQIEQILDLRGGMARLSSGEEIAVQQLWPVIASSGVVDRLLDGEFDEIEHVLNRIELFPHQLDAACRAIQQEEVRWLLADEVGLGKTIVAHMITSAMLRLQRIEKVVILAPEALVMQWLGELYKKFHQVFVYIDAERIEHVSRDFGPEANPFELHPLSLMSYEFLAKNPQWGAAIAASSPELFVADEAHRLLDPKLEPVVRPLIEQATHALLLTATPFQLGEEGFLRLADMLRLPHQQDAAGRQIVRQVSAVSREDIKRLPARQPEPVVVADISKKIDEADPRVQWLAAQITTWKKEKKRALIFVNDARRAKKLTEILSRASHQTLFCFHEEMDTQNRDIELSRFRLSSSPAMITSGAGSEGRNFQFCDVLVHFDLPRDPTVLEQRIGRLDRIGRSGDIPIHYFLHDGAEGALARAYESLGVFADAAIGASPAMNRLRLFLEDHDPLHPDLPRVIEQVREALAVSSAQWIFPDSHQIEEGPMVMAQIPKNLEELTERFVTEAAKRVGLDVLEKEGAASYSFEYGSRVVVDAIPGLAPEAHYLGSFDREEALLNQELDFFGSGHVLVEGLLAELEDSTAGAVGALHLKESAWRGGAPKGWERPGLYLLVSEGEVAGKQHHELFCVAGERSGAKLSLDARQLRTLFDLADQARAVSREYIKQTAMALESAQIEDKLGQHGEVLLALVFLIGG